MMGLSIDRDKVIKGLEGIYRCVSPVVHTCGDCPYQDNHVECKRRAVSDAIALLKEQEPTKTGHWIFESRYYDAWSNICSECGRLLTTAVDTYANYCSNCGAKMTGGDSIGSEIPNS